MKQLILILFLFTPFCFSDESYSPPQISAMDLYRQNEAKKAYKALTQSQRLELERRERLRERQQINQELANRKRNVQRLQNEIDKEKLISNLNYINQFSSNIIDFLKNDGWQEVKVLGNQIISFNDGESEEEYLVAECSPWTYFLEPKTFASLQPGLYLGKMSYTSCELIDDSGGTVEFWTKETK